MRTHVPLGLTLALAAGAYAQQDGRVHAGEQPPQPLRGDIHGFADPGRIRSFTQLCGRADAIVDGVVETDDSRLMPDPGRGLPIETDFRIAVNRALKGSIDTPELVVSEKGGTVGELHLIMNFPLLQRGDRYILFLYADKRPGIPPVPGLPRYQAEIFYGTFKVGEGKIRPFFRNPFEGKYTGLTSDEFAAAVAAELKH
jgi:hypothetical protein